MLHILVFQLIGGLFQLQLKRLSLSLLTHADSLYFLSRRDEEIRRLTEAFGRLLQTEEGRNQARQLIHAQANDEVDANSISTGSEATCDSEDWNSEEWESADEAEGSFGV